MLNHSPEILSFVAEAVRAELYVRSKAIADDFDDLPEIVRLASRLEPRVRREFLSAIRNIDESIDVEQLARAVLAGNLTAIESAAKLDDWDDFGGTLDATIRTGFMQGAGFAMKDLGELSVGLNFEAVNPLAVEWANAASSSLIVGIKQTQREAISRIVARAASGELNVFDAAKEIKDHVGLDARRIATLEKFQARLVAQGVEPEALARRVAKFRAAQLRDRSLTIARTEIINAHNQGQLGLWRTAVREGRISQSEFLKVWIVTPDDRLHIGCEELDDVAVEIDGFWDSEVGPIASPGMHPRCRCSMGLIPREGR